MTAADRRVSARRYCVARIMEFMATRGGRAAPVDPQSRPSWTRLPLYLPRTPTSEDLAGPSRFIELTQPMHDEPPSALAMFRNLPKRVVPGTSRVRDPLLVKPADEIGDT